MTGLLSQLTVIVLLAVIVIVVLKVCGFTGKNKEDFTSLLKTPAYDGEEKVYNADLEKTSVMPFWKIEVLDKRGYIINSKEIPDVEGKGFYIGRSSECDLQIKDSYVGKKHAVISKDAKGYFLKDCNSANHVYYNKKRIHQIDLEDKMMIYIANTPCRIVKIDPFEEFGSADLKLTKVRMATQDLIHDLQIKRDEE